MENLCLYGLPDGSWHLSNPPLRVLPQLPEPTLGINFARDGMEPKDWLALIAVHTDSWLLSVAFYYGASLNHNGRYVDLSYITFRHCQVIFCTVAVLIELWYFAYRFDYDL